MKEVSVMALVLYGLAVTLVLCGAIALAGWADADEQKRPCTGWALEGVFYRDEDGAKVSYPLWKCVEHADKDGGP